MEPRDFELPGPSAKSKPKEKPKPKILIPSKPLTSSASTVHTESETLHTPILISTPSLTPFTASLVFTYPSGSLDTSASVSSQSLPDLGSFSQPSSHRSRTPQPCSVAHRRSSSSGDQSDHSLNSPTILTLWFLVLKTTVTTMMMTTLPTVIMVKIQAKCIWLISFAHSSSTHRKSTQTHYNIFAYAIVVLHYFMALQYS